MTQTVAAGSSTRPTVVRVRGFGPQRIAAEQELARNGIVLPLPQRAEWAQAQGATDSVLFIVRDGGGTPIAAAAGSVTRTRALPGHTLYRFERLGSTGQAEVDALLIGTITRIARRDQRCLRVFVELFDRDADARDRLAGACGAEGFAKLPRARNYDRTLGLDLSPSEDEIFMSVNSKARRGVRAPAKKGMQLRVIEQPSLGDRLQSLMQETYARTGAVPQQIQWAKLVELSARNPLLSRVVGLFDGKTEGPEGLVAFAWGCRHGTYATFEAGASTRRADLGGTPLGYAPMWDLITWARGNQATWFDFGGITGGDTTTGADVLGGISDFKREFCNVDVQVGEDWVLEPHPLRASIARTLTTVAKRFGRAVSTSA